MEKRVLHITNGEYFNEYFLEKFGGEAVPFCEAMMDGTAEREIFSEEFVAARCECLGVEEAEYRAKMRVCEALRDGGAEISVIQLWFGKDCFCQMNLLTVLAYLEQIGYGGVVVLNLIDDESFAVLEEAHAVSLGIYRSLYEEIFISKRVPSVTGCLEREAVELYFDYHSSEGKLAKLVRGHTGSDEMDLICLLLRESKEYGLSDLQAKQLIERERGA